MDGFFTHDVQRTLSALQLKILSLYDLYIWNHGLLVALSHFYLLHIFSLSHENEIIVCVLLVRVVGGDFFFFIDVCSCYCLSHSHATLYVWRMVCVCGMPSHFVNGSVWWIKEMTLSPSLCAVHVCVYAFPVLKDIGNSVNWNNRMHTQQICHCPLPVPKPPPPWERQIQPVSLSMQSTD